MELELVEVDWSRSGLRWSWGGSEGRLWNPVYVFCIGFRKLQVQEIHPRSTNRNPRYFGACQRTKTTRKALASQPEARARVQC